MKKYLTTALLLTVIVFAACAQHRTITRVSTKKVKAKNLSITEVTMSRGACFGRCPIYSVTIKSNGMVQYKGRNFTDHIGVYERKLTPQQTGQVLQAFKEYRVDTCASTYELRIADVPGIFYKITINGKVKQIGNAHFGPGYLKDLAKDIDALAQVDDSWTKVSSDVPE